MVIAPLAPVSTIHHAPGTFTTQNQCEGVFLPPVPSWATTMAKSCPGQ